MSDSVCFVYSVVGVNGLEHDVNKRQARSGKQQRVEMNSEFLCLMRGTRVPLSSFSFVCCLICVVMYLTSLDLHFSIYYDVRWAGAAALEPAAPPRPRAEMPRSLRRGRGGGRRMYYMCLPDQGRGSRAFLHCHVKRCGIIWSALLSNLLPLFTSPSTRCFFVVVVPFCLISNTRMREITSTVFPRGGGPPMM